MEEEWWSPVLKGDCVWVAHTSNTRVCISTKDGKGPRMSGSKEDDRSGVREEGYAAFCE